MERSGGGGGREGEGKRGREGEGNRGREGRKGEKHTMHVQAAHYACMTGKVFLFMIWC